MKSKAFSFVIIASVILLILVGLMIFWSIGVYNNIVTVEQNVVKQWAQVENQYQRRVDLIPNLVSTVKGYANFEKQVLTDVVEARSRVGQINVTPEVLNNPQTFQKFQSAQGELSSALSRLLAVVENYPELKANENFLQLQAQLEGTENRISVERKRFNDNVQEYNTLIKRFPAKILASIFGFFEKQYFTATPGSDMPPKVEF